MCSGTFSETVGGPVISMALETLMAVTTCPWAGVSPREIIVICNLCRLLGTSSVHETQPSVVIARASWIIEEPARTR